MGLRKTCSMYKYLALGVVRNVGKFVYSDILAIHRVLKTRGSVDWFVVESDSEDSTLVELKRVRDEISSFRYVSLGNLRDEIPERTARIASCRNRYLNELELNPQYAEIDLVVVVDLDGVNNALDEKGLATCFQGPAWDVCCTNQAGPYYDIWALRHHEWCPSDCLAQKRFLIEHGVSEYRATVSSIYSRMITIPRGSEWVEVDSAFGGFAIYKRKILDRVRYSGLDPQGGEICEHVSVNREIKSRGGRIYINPNLINAGLVEHSRNATVRGLVRYWFVCKLREFLSALGLLEPWRSLWR